MSRAEDHEKQGRPKKPSLLKAILVGAVTGLLTGGQPPPKGLITIKRIPPQASREEAQAAIGWEENPAGKDGCGGDSAKDQPSLLKTILVGAITGILTGGCPPPKDMFTIKITPGKPSGLAKKKEMR